jgi:hypothetical protein
MIESKASSRMQNNELPTEFEEEKERCLGICDELLDVVSIVSISIWDLLSLLDY